MEFKDKYNIWIDDAAVDADTKNELKSITDKSEIEDRFYKELSFGTGGLRGVMGAGTNRMNVYTVRKATQGVANEILSHGTEFAEKGVVIAYDSRNNSKEFAYECTRVLSANGVKTYIFDSLRPTPELSFAVRHLGCARGIVITASHNPKEYNGYKVYGEDGGQIPPYTAETIQRFIDQTDIFEGVRLTDSPNNIIIGDEVDSAYISAVKEQSCKTVIPEDFKAVYTPLHGSGNLLVRRILSEIGVKNVFVVPEQEKPDGNFPTVKSPNPENSEAFDIAVEYAKEQNADIVFGTDPDSDRLGVVVRNAAGEYMVLNGNQTGCLLCEYILRKAKENGTLPTDGAVVKTIVTTETVRAIAADYGIETIDVLTGFKFIGDQIKGFEQQGRAERFIFGLEESYGYLKGTYARDKDAVVAAMLICEAAADYKAHGMTLYEGLQAIYEKYGYSIEKLKTITLKGIDGAEQIQSIMSRFRDDGLSIDTVKKLDYLEGIDGLPKSDVLKFFTPNGWFAVRPSGTEPKIKFYFGASGGTSVAAQTALEKMLTAADDVIGHNE
jgi:phosphoglucomutase